MKSAYDKIPQDGITIKARIAAAVINLHPMPAIEEEFVKQCHDLARRILSGIKYEQDNSLFLTLLSVLCSNLLRRDLIQEANELLKPHWAWIDINRERLPWKFDYVAGWLLYSSGKYHVCWSYIESALAKLDEDVPAGEESQFAPFWLQDKAEFQNCLITIAMNLVKRNLLSVDTLIIVYESLNGREITAKTNKGNNSNKANQTLSLPEYRDRIRSCRKDAVIFCFMESEDKIELIVISTHRGTVEILEGLEFNPQEISRLRNDVKKAFKKANPADLALLDSRLVAWEALGKRIGASIAPYLSPDTLVCWLPGRTFTGLPLHLVPLPTGSRLIEQYCVSYAPNLTTLLRDDALFDNPPAKNMSLVTVTKRTESSEFKQRALDASENLLNSLSNIGPTIWLREQEADHKSVAQAMRSSYEIVFLCHGTTAGPERGYGICIADSKMLPPPLLSVAEFPDQARFILTWQDIERSPRLVVSIACSSGITEVAKGGVRFGLEQSLFASGTQLIISPLWDVEQAPSLAWIEALYQNRLKHPDWAMEKSFQSACLETSKRFPHFYHWGAFVLNGSI
jgi:CHAT domain-containing protein